MDLLVYDQPVVFIQGWTRQLRFNVKYSKTAKTTLNSRWNVMLKAIRNRTSSGLVINTGELPVYIYHQYIYFSLRLPWRRAIDIAATSFLLTQFTI